MTPGREAIARWLLARLTAELGDDTHIERDRPLADYGLTSVVAAGVAGDLEDWLDVDLDPTVFFEHPTVDALAEALSEQVEAR